jgi:hypothetical protein
MQALKYTSREVNRNFRIKVSGLGIHELKGFTGFVGLVGSELANNLLDRAFRSKADKVECKLRASNFALPFLLKRLTAFIYDA